MTLKLRLSSLAKTQRQSCRISRAFPTEFQEWELQSHRVSRPSRPGTPKGSEKTVFGLFLDSGAHSCFGLCGVPRRLFGLFSDSFGVPGRETQCGVRGIATWSKPLSKLRTGSGGGFGRVFGGSQRSPGRGDIPENVWLFAWAKDVPRKVET